MDLSTVVVAALVVGVALLLIALSRLSGDGPGLAELFKAPTDLDWPRGVQEDEPVRWRVELLEPSNQKAIALGVHAAAVGRDGSTHADRQASYPIT
jgi:hypothetical protein